MSSKIGRRLFDYVDYTARGIIIVVILQGVCRDDESIEDAWHDEVGTVGLNHTMISRLQWNLRCLW